MADAQQKKSQSPEMPKADFITALVLLAASIAIIALALDLPRLEHRDINPWTIPGLVPALLGGVLGFCLLYALVLIGWLPYVLSTFIFVFIFILLFEYDRGTGLNSQRRRIVVAGVEAVIVAAAIASLFQYVFLVRLP